MNKLLLPFFMLLLICSTAWAQTRKITGKVSDDKGAMVGVSIKLKGTTTATTTNSDGKFTVNIPATGNVVLVFSYIGSVTKEVTVGTRSEINVTLQDDQQGLNEVVVIGYGTVARKDLAGAVGSLKGSEIAKTPVANIAEALTGRIPGVQVTTLDGAPGADVIIRVRGGGSITQDNTPLYIVDGFIVDNINNIAPTDIESVDVLKDASSTAIYGARGANGVVIITTKSPKAGKTAISYNGYGQAKTLPRKLEVLSPYDFALVQYEYGMLRGQTSSEFKNFTRYFGVYDDLELYKYQKPTDWQEELFGRFVNSQQHNLSLTGGTDKTKLSFNSTYNKDEGLMLNSGQERFYLNFKLNHQISNKLKLDLAARYSATAIDGAGTSGTSSIRISDGIQTRPVNGLADQIVLDPDDVAEGNDDFDNFLRSVIKPTDLVQQDYRKRTNNDLSLNAALGWDVDKKLTLRSELSVIKRNNVNKRYWGPLTGESRNVGLNKPLVELSSGTSNTYRWVNTANYKVLKKKDHNLSVLLGQELNTTSGSSVFNRAKYFEENLTPEMVFANMASGTSERVETLESRGEDLISGFGRINYTFKDRYILYLTLRADGSSKFGPSNRWGYFPAASFAWRVSDEAFMKNIDVISDLKFRASYGEAGNNRINNDVWRFVFGNTQDRSYGAGDIAQTYYRPVNKTLPNPDLKWETTVSRNLGLDFGLFNNKISATLDIYKNTTKDLIVENDIPPQTGFSAQYLNIGQTSNRGIELSLNANLITKKDFTLSASFNIGRNQPKIDKLDGNDRRVARSEWAGTDLKTREDYLLEVGKTIGLMFGYVSDGFYTVDDFLSYNPATRTYVLKPGVPTSGGLLGGTIGIRPGTMKLKDLDGDGLVTADKDRRIIGSAVPSHSGGFGLNATYKSFDISTFFNWVYGNQIYNTGRIQFNMLYRTTFGNMLNTMNYEDRFKYINGEGQLVTELNDLAELNKNAKIWSPFSSGTASPLFSDDAVEDGSFFRMTYITLGYTLPKKLTSKVGISSLRFYGTAYNVFLLTNYTGYDPEVSTTRSGGYAALTPGVDYSAYPKSRTYTFGLSLSF
ncbi:TonB-linked outer membrane protein, SusC/RagA family [Pedobacter sp. ok626]|uniref:SusC/RagA family TonB-linked outer membrane protein n=1 Tax=Pedobacter sp. ok626 TaxID=1761882 RepID=UPI0008876AFA|nr:TonB-dependent receptor [Pedobacter sp. ok626]SDL74961.1 TonB-linked outer membrane protein, SusC/RagA family [Pedobacter sp. ok626]